MNKKFTNSFGAEIVFKEHGIDFSTRNSYILYENIESIRLKSGGKSFWVYYELGKCDFFVIDENDREEFKELVKEIKEVIKEESREDDVKQNVRKYTRSHISIMLFAWIFTGIFILLEYYELLALGIVLLLSIAFMLTWLTNTCRRIVPDSLVSFKKRNIIIQVILILLCIGVAIGSFFYFKPGFRSGEHLDRKCYFYECDKYADGGMYYGGLKGSDKYYCKEHFEIEKNWEDNKNGEAEPDEYEIWVIAKNEVKDNLKSPSTASFCSQSSATITKSGKTWTVIGYVDAQNSFGAEVRTNFKVVITFSSGNKYTATCTFN